MWNGICDGVAGSYEWSRVRQPPPAGPKQAEAAGENEDPAPVGVTENGSDQRRGYDRSYGRPGVDDAHGGCAFFCGEPFRDRTSCGREAPAFTYTQQESACGQHRETGSQGVAGTGERPEQHNHRKSAMSSQEVHQLSASCVHQRVREKKRGLESRELSVGQRNVLTDRLDRDRQSLSIEIADRDGSTDQDGDSPAQIVPPFDASSDSDECALYAKMVNVYSVCPFPLQSLDPELSRRPRESKAARGPGMFKEGLERNQL